MSKASSWNAATMFLAAGMALHPVAWGATTIQDLGLLPGMAGSSSSSAMGVSAEGQAVTGFASGGRSFRWTATEGMRDLGSTSGVPSLYARAINESGDAIAGYMDLSPPGGTDVRAFRWTSAGGVEALCASSSFSMAYDISADGGVVVGRSDMDGMERAFRWDASAGMLDLGTLPPHPDWAGDYSVAYGVSGDGRAVTGLSNGRVFRWTAASGMQDLGGLPDSYITSGMAANVDGSVIVGESVSETSPVRAFRWTSHTGITQLDYLPGAVGASALSVSADGQFAVGMCDDRAVLWVGTAAVDLATLFAQQGIDLTGWRLTACFSISDDGRSMAGTGYHNGLGRAWLVSDMAGSPFCAGDANADGVTSLADIAKMIQHWATGVTPFADGDVSGNGVVGLEDVAEAISNWGNSCH